MKLLKTHVNHGVTDGDRMVASLYECELGFFVTIDIEIEENIHVAHIESNDDNLALWNEIVS